MKKGLAFSLLLTFLICGFADKEEATAIAIDTYSLTLSLRVPQVFSNTTSQGYRKYQLQRIKGNINIVWMSDGTFSFEFKNLVNKNFKVGGVAVTYKGYEGSDVVYPRFTWIGDNKTSTFNMPTLTMYVELEPNYAIGGNTEDNSFYLLLSGKGSSSYKPMYKSRIATSFYGYASGTQGCGCSAYGHKSPTRRASISGPSEYAEDAVSTFGTWRASWKGRTYL